MQIVNDIYSQLKVYKTLFEVKTFDNDDNNILRNRIDFTMIPSVLLLFWRVKKEMRGCGVLLTIALLIIIMMTIAK